jgi:hypothetical protein
MSVMDGRWPEEEETGAVEVFPPESTTTTITNY